MTCPECDSLRAQLDSERAEVTRLNNRIVEIKGAHDATAETLRKVERDLVTEMANGDALRESLDAVIACRPDCSCRARARIAAHDALRARGAKGGT